MIFIYVIVNRTWKTYQIYLLFSSTTPKNKVEHGTTSNNIKRFRGRFPEKQVKVLVCKEEALYGHGHLNID